MIGVYQHCHLHLTHEINLSLLRTNNDLFLIFIFILSAKMLPSLLYFFRPRWSSVHVKLQNGLTNEFYFWFNFLFTLLRYPLVLHKLIQKLNWDYFQVSYHFYTDYLLTSLFELILGKPYRIYFLLQILLFTQKHKTKPSLYFLNLVLLL